MVRDSLVAGSSEVTMVGAESGWRTAVFARACLVRKSRVGASSAFASAISEMEEGFVSVGVEDEAVDVDVVAANVVFAREMAAAAVVL